MPLFGKTASRINIENQISEAYPKLELTIDHDNLLEGVKVAVKTFKPHWPEHHLTFVPFKGGLTNKLYMCQLEGSDEKLLCRVYGKNSEYLIDREQELVNLVSLERVGLSPPLFGRFENGFCYGYLRGEPLDTAGMSDPHIAPLTAAMLGKWHRAHVSGDMAPMLWETIDKWLSVGMAGWISRAPTAFEDPAKDALLKQRCSLAEIRREVAELRGHLDKLDSPIAFCHNDLLCKNILFDADADEVHFIDYEYGNYSYRGFDIGNHFCEFAGMEEPVDYTKYPTRDFQLQWLRWYLNAYNAGQRVLFRGFSLARLVAMVTPAAVSDDEIEALYREVNKFALAAHFYWGVWALVQARFSDIDFDYLGYALIRFDEYHKNKQAFLAL